MGKWKIPHTLKKLLGLSLAKRTYFAVDKIPLPDNGKKRIRFDLRSRYMQLAIVFFVAVGIATFSNLSSFIGHTHASSYTWDGGGTEDNCPGNSAGWSCAYNWSSDLVPGSGDTVTFNGTSTKSATIDAGFGGTVAGMIITSAYSGTITAGIDLTINGDFSQAAGTFIAPSGNLALKGNITFSGGTFTHSSGTTIFAPASSTMALVLNTNPTFSNLIIDLGNGSLEPHNTNCNYTVAGNLTFRNTGTHDSDYQLVSSNESSTTTVQGNFSIEQTGTGPIRVGGADNPWNVTFVVAGNVSINNQYATVYANMTFNTSADQTITRTASTISGRSSYSQYSGYWRANKTGGSLIFATNTTLPYLATDSASANFTIANSASAVPTITNFYTISNGTVALTCDMTIGYMSKTGGTFTHSSGTVTLNGSTTNTLSGVTFNNLTIDTTTNWIYIKDSFTVNGDLTIKNSGSSAQRFLRETATGTPPVVTVNGNVSIPAGGSGTLYVGWGSGDGYNIKIAFAGNLTLAKSNLYLQNYFDFIGSGAQHLSTSVSYASDSGYWKSVKTGGSITPDSNFTIGNTFYCGSDNSSPFATNGSNKITFTTFTANSCANWAWPSTPNTLQFNNLAVSAGTFTPDASYSNNFTGTVTISGTGTMNFPASYNTTFAGFTQSGGTFTSTSGTLTISGVMNRTSGTFTHNSGTVTMTASGINGDMTTANATFNNVILSPSAGNFLYIHDSYTVAGDLTFRNDTSSSQRVMGYNPNSATITVNGTTSTAGTGSGGFDVGWANNGYNFALALKGNLSLGYGVFHANTTFSGTTDQTIAKTSGTLSDGGDWVINKASGEARLTGALGTVPTLAVTAGTLNLNGQNLTTTATPTVAAGGTWKMVGSETFTNPTLTAGATVEYAGTSGSRAIKDWTYYNLKFSGSGATYTFPTDKTLTSLTITAGTIDLNGKNINVSGAVAVSTGTLSGTTSILTLSGAAAQSVTLNNATFANIIVTNSHADGVTFGDGWTVSNTFTATDSNVKKLVFTSGSTYVIKNLSIAGDGSHRITLAASSTSAWNLTDLSGTIAVSYVDVAYSNSAAAVRATNSKDSGHNTNWNLVSTIIVDLPASGTVNATVSTTITLEDATGAAVSSVVGSTTVTVDSGIVTPTSIAANLFTNGVWTGNLTLNTVGSRTVTATNTSVSGQDTISVAPGALDHFSISAPTTATVWTALSGSVSIVAYDAWSNVKTDYVGSVYFSSSDSNAVLPYTTGSKYTFVQLDAGSKVFDAATFTLKTVGTQTITVTDGLVSQASSNITVSPGAIDSFSMTGAPATTVAGSTFSHPTNDIMITAKDAHGNTKTDYAGQIWFASSDLNENVLLPYTSDSKYTFISGDSGVHTFSGAGFKLITANANQTISLKNGSSVSDVISDNIAVTPAIIDHFSMLDYPNSSTGQWVTSGADWSQSSPVGGSGAPYDVTVTAYDQYSNIKTDFSGDVWFSMGEGVSAILPYDSAENALTFSSNGITPRSLRSDTADNGRHIFNAEDFIVNTSGDSLAFNVNTSGISSNFTIKVKPSDLASVGVVFSPEMTSTLIDTTLTQNVTVTAYDGNGNVKTDYDGSIYFTSTDTSAVLPYISGSKYNFVEGDAGSKTFTPINTADNYFQFRTPGTKVLSAVASKTIGTVTGNSVPVTISAHAPSTFQATAGHQLVILDWLTPNEYSQYEVDGLSNGTTYYFTFKSVDLKSDNSEVESAASDQVSAIPADIAARRVTAIQLSDGRVQVNYSLRYDSTVSIQYYNVDTATWVNTSSGAVSGDISEGQTGSVDLPEHTAYWLAKTDYPNQYFALTDGFKVRIKVIVPSQGNTTAYSPSQVLTLDTAPPHAAALTVDASAGTSVDLTLAAAEDPNSTIQMTISNDSGFDGGVWQDFASSVTGWDPAGSAAVYVKLKDSFSNETVLSYSYPEVIQNFILKDGSDLRIPKYTLFLTWKETSLPNFSKYIVERKAGDGSFSEVFRTTQAAYIDLNLSKDSLYSYKVKILDTEGNISQPSNILASQPGLAPDVTAAPTIQVFGYKQEIGVKAIIDWKTDQYADSFVAFSTEELTNESNIKTVSGQNAIVYGQLDRVLEHEVTITGLQPGKKYYMKVLSQNDIKITGYSDFFIVSTPAYIALEIKNLTFSDLLPTSVWVNWQTNKTSTTKLVYGMNSNFDRTLTDTGLNTDHKFKLENLTPGANYKLQITATDEDGNSVASDEYNVNPPSNPAISAITLKSIGNNAATVDWTTNVGADSSVEFGKDTSYGFASGKSDLVIQHEIQLIGLESKTLYHFRIKSRDIFGTEVMSSDQTFTTISDTTPPVVSNISTQLSQVSTPQGLVYQATISWQTDEGSTSQVEYGDSTSGQYSKKTQEDDSFNMHHVVILSDLKANSAISFRVVSKDSSQNEAISKNNTIITPPEEGSLYKIVINSLSDTFSWVTKLKDKFSKK